MTDSNQPKSNYVGYFDGNVTVALNSIVVESRADGSVRVTNAAGGTLFTRRADNAEPEIGDKMPNGTVFAGISPDTGKPMYVTPVDAPLTMKWNRAMEYARGLDAHGRRDWRVPSDAELDVLFNNRAAIGGFVTYGKENESWYWSSKQDKEGLRPDIAAVARHFADDGEKAADFKLNKFAVRCVCG